jgi:hypothetical protein
MNFSTVKLFNIELFNHEPYFSTTTQLHNSDLELNLEVEQSRVEMSFLLRCSTPDFSTPRLNPDFFRHERFNQDFLSTGLKLHTS